MFGAVKLTKNADPDKYSYSGHGIGFDSSLFSSYPGYDWTKTVVIFDNISSAHTDNKKKCILVLVESPKKGLNNTMVISEAKYCINFSKSQTIF